MSTPVHWGSFVWDAKKESHNISLHGIDFCKAAEAFNDPERIILVDEKHSVIEPRWFCIGLVDDDIVTIRFTYRFGEIRIIGAGRWRKGKKLYEATKAQRS